MRPLLGASVAGLVAFCAMMRSAGCLGSNILVIVETAESDAVMGQILPDRPPRRPEAAPKLNLIVTGVLMSAAVVASTSPTMGRQFTIVADLTVVFSMFAYLAVCLALLRMSGDAAPGRRGPIRAIAIAAALFCCGIIAASEPDLLIWSACGIGVAALVWLPVRWRRRRLA
jgi:arginine:agmatine antiporter